MGTSSNNRQFDYQNVSHDSEKQIYDIVFVDDDELVLEIVDRKLRSSSFLFTSIECPQKAEEFLQVQQTRVLVVDYRMPAMNGLELIQLTKHYPLMNSTEIYLASSVTLPRQVQLKAQGLGSQCLLKESFSEPEFLENLMLPKSSIL